MAISEAAALSEMATSEATLSEMAISEGDPATRRTRSCVCNCQRRGGAGSGDVWGLVQSDVDKCWGRYLRGMACGGSVRSVAMVCLQCV